jgi:hypothetical protein
MYLKKIYIMIFFLLFQNFGTPGFLGEPTGMYAHFNNDENVKKVVFNANGNFAIKEIKGTNIEEIELSGKMLTISTLCPFLRTKKDLPKLRKVSLTNIGIKNFKANQDCGNDSLTTHLQTTIPMKVEVCYIALQPSAFPPFGLTSLRPFQLRPFQTFGLSSLWPSSLFIVEYIFRF